MPKNTFFQFKQFRIEQGMAAMKVCTDACIFGALVSVPLSVKNILDIGTGTGLLALMLAQKTDALIDAVEINAQAFAQAKENISNSPWYQRINVIEKSIQEYSMETSKKYDLIISNPPFFENHLKSVSDARNKALHSESLSLDELLISVMRLLTEDGVFYLLLPTQESKLFEAKAKFKGLYLNERRTISHSALSPIIREISCFKFHKHDLIEKDMIIKENNGNYTADFIELLKEYYLNF